ncbi:MAG TPA: efflux transporter outer membrane subunit [Casimicrobiaceae bacterium]|nr:efflux transporter outer membrane subunit [Casimicrobiaceae bacterium]
MRRVPAILAIALGVASSGCMVGPDYVRPGVDVPPAWRVDYGMAADTANSRWWEQFGDSALDELIEAALRANRDVRIAAARVDEFGGRLAVARAALFPQVAASADATRQRVTRHQPLSRIPADVSPTYDSYDAILSASWEIDLWGKLRRSTEAARADLLATEEARRSVVLSLVASVASGYISLRDLDRQLEIARDTTKTRADSLQVFELRFKGGVVSELQLAQNRSEYAQALASIPQIEDQIAQTENALSLLLGRNPGSIPRGRAIDALLPPAIPEGLPSDLLERRPDLRQAEAQLAAANARIGVAKAAYFPSISLTGALGSASTQLSSLFSGPAGLWSYGASLVAPIFTAGAIAGQVEQAEAQQQQALFSYQKAIQSAFSDVDNALVDHAKSRERLQALSQQVDALATYARLARLRYENGYTSYIEVLDAERSLFAAQLQYADQQALVLNALVNLYKAMGGGWVDLADGDTGASRAPARTRLSVTTPP